MHRPQNYTFMYSGTNPTPERLHPSVSDRLGNVLTSLLQNQYQNRKPLAAIFGAGGSCEKSPVPVFLGQLPADLWWERGHQSAPLHADSYTHARARANEQPTNPPLLGPSRWLHVPPHTFYPSSPLPTFANSSPHTRFLLSLLKHAELIQAAGCGKASQSLNQC